MIHNTNGAQAFCAEPLTIGGPPALPPAPEPPLEALANAVRERHPLRIALALARIGFQVFPLRRGTKDGLLNAASNHGATSDPFAIHAAFTGKDHNVGIWLGDQFVAIDPDLYKPGVPEAWAALRAEVGEFPETFTTKSARGGRHFIFRTDNERFSNSPLAPGIDVKACNAYVLAPGSWFEDDQGRGGFYEFEVAALAEALPDKLRSLLRRSSARGAEGPRIVGELDENTSIAAAVEMLKRAAPAIEGRAGDWHTFVVACSVIDLGISAAKTIELMAEHWNPRCQPPWDIEGEKSLSTKVENAWRYRSAEVGRDNPAAGFEAVPPHLVTAERAAADPDMSVLHVNRCAPPMMPVWVFGTLEPWLLQQAEAKSAPVDYVVAAFLGAAAGVIGATRRVGEWREPAILWNGAVGAPSTNKSPAFDAVFDSLRRVEKGMAANFDVDLRDYEGRKRAAAVLCSKWEREVDAAAAAGLTPPPKPPGADEPSRPTFPRVKVADVTTEALARDLAQNPRGFLLHRDELAGWLGNMDRYGGKGSDRPFFLETFGGRSYVVDRISQERPRFVKHMHLSLVGGIQPDRLDSMLLNSDDDGLAARLLFYWPDPAPLKRSSVRPDNAPVERVFQRLLILGFDVEGEPVELPLSQEAAEAVWEWRVRHAPQVLNATGMHASALGKFPGYVLRLALVLELLKWAAGDAAREPHEVGIDATLGAITLVDDYFKPMLVRVLGEAATGEMERNVRRLAQAIIERGASKINARDISRTWSLPGLKKERVEATCGELVEAGWLTRLAANGGAGRPAKDYAVKPRVLEILRQKKGSG